MSCFVGHPVAAKPDRARSRSGRAGLLYNLQPAEARHSTSSRNRGDVWGGVEFISIYNLSIRYVKGGEEGADSNIL